MSKKSANNTVKVGVGCFVFKDGKFLMGQRKSSHGASTWSIPGGHMEYGESLEQTTAREVKEEVRIKIKNVRFGAITNDYFPKENKHYLTVWMLSDYASGQERMVEPDYFINLRWASFDNLPAPLFLPWRQLLKSQFIDSIKAEAKKTI